MYLLLQFCCLCVVVYVCVSVVLFIEGLFSHTEFNEIEKALNRGKTIQFRQRKEGSQWKDCTKSDSISLYKAFEYRVKPE